MTAIKLPFEPQGKKLHHTKYSKNYQHYILESVDDVACQELGFNPTEQGKIKYIKHRFESEVGKWFKGSKIEALTHWLEGLALDIPYLDHDILELARLCGSAEASMSEKLQERIISNYFNFMANQVYRMLND